MKIRKIQLLGPFNTGTNLLGNILKNNIKQDIMINKYGQILFWKHSINKLFIEKNIISNPDTLFICIYKPLHNWICSMKKASYKIKWDKTLTGKCHFQKNLIKISSRISYQKDKYYNNIIEIYNEYYNIYIDLINSYKRVIFMNYYDIIDKKNVVEYITNKLNVFNLSLINDNNILNILDKPSKKHGNSVNNSTDALKKKNECYNNINKSLKNRLIILIHFDYKIRLFFENY